MNKKIRPKIRYYDSEFYPDFFYYMGIITPMDIAQALFEMYYNKNNYKILSYKVTDIGNGKISVTLKIEKLQNLKSYAKK